jgi:GNAT superfamily N-acetyltransferase
VLGLLDEAAAWLAGRGVVQWPASFRPEWVEPAVADGRVWLAEAGGVAVGTFRLDWADPMWTDLPAHDEAGYLHRFAVARSRAGLGAALLERADEEVRRRGRHLLRLDCMADNPRLREYYEAAGFAHRGEVELPESITVWPDGRPLLSRYERAVR